MNNKGQVLVMFVILIPLIIFVIDLFIEQINLNYNKTKVDNILELACIQVDIDEYISKNDKILSVEIENRNGQTVITTTKKVNSILAKIVGINEFTIKNKKICKGD